MIGINIITDLLINYYFSRWLIMATGIYGMFRLIKYLMTGR